MLRFALFATAVAALVAPARSADSPISGNWVLTTLSPYGGESVVCVLKTGTKDGKPFAEAVSSPPNVETTVTDFRVTGETVSVSLKQVRTVKDRKFTTETAFAGIRGKNAAEILGSTGDYRFRTRAKLAATDKTELTPKDLQVRGDVPEPMTKYLELAGRVNQALNKAFQEKDPEKKKDLREKATAIRKEADEQTPGLYREVVEKHADSQAALTAATSLVRLASKLKMPPAEANKLVALIKKHATPYGPLFAAVTTTQVSDALVDLPGLGTAALEAIEPSARALADDAPLNLQAEVLAAYKAALAKVGGKDETRRAVETRFAKVDAALDAEYVKNVPPFKPAAFAGRKDKAANRVAVMELFTGAQCPPCVAADVGFDALLKAYKPTDLVLLQYHMHIPGPDPLTNPTTVARWDYYTDLFPDDVGGTSSTLVNGKPAAGGGGPLAGAESKFGQYAAAINPLLEKSTDVAVAGKATRAGDRIDVAVEVTGADDGLKLRLLLVEENVKYVGSNGVRFHHQVVRAAPGGAEGVAVKGKAFKHSASVDLATVRKELTAYLNDYAANTRPFPKPDRPMEMKALRVVALVQNDKTGEIVQAVQIDVPVVKPGTGS